MSDTEVDTEEKNDTFVSQAMMLLQVTFLLHQFLSSMIKKYPIKKVIPEPSVAVFVGMVVAQSCQLLNLMEVLNFLAEFNENLFMIIILPPIIFSTAFSMDTNAFSRNFFSILTQAIIGTLMASFITFGCLMFQNKIMPKVMEFEEIAAFSVLISATDPVSVISLFHVISVDRTLNILVIGEALLNDAVAIVLSRSLKSALFSGESSVLDVAGSFLWVFGGSIMLGITCGIFISLVIKWMYNSKTQAKMLTVLTFPQLCQILAEAIYLSGIVSLLFCGIIMGNQCFQNLKQNEIDGRAMIYDTIAYIFETYVFFIIGYDMIMLQNLILDFSFAFVIQTIAVIVLARFIQLKFLSFFLNLQRTTIPITEPFQTVMLIGGLRGAVAYAVAIDTIGTYPNSNKIITLTQIVTIITIFVFGAFLEPQVDSVDILDKGKDLGAMGYQNLGPINGIKQFYYEIIHKQFVDILIQKKDEIKSNSLSKPNGLVEMQEINLESNRIV